MLDICDVTLKFSGLVAMQDLSIHIPRSGVTGIIGPNGAGKSTLFNAITGLTPYQQGSISFEGELLSQLSAEQVTNRGIARTFQNIRLLSNLNVLENLLIACTQERKGTFFSSLFSLKSARKLQQEIEERAYELLDLFSLTEFAKRVPTTLAYGDQRKLEIARALMRKPKLLMLDEPAAGMNATEKTQLMQIIQKISVMNIKVLVIEHDMKFIMNLCDHIFVLNQGKLVAHGTPEEIQKNDNVISIYLGSSLSNKTDI